METAIAAAADEHRITEDTARNVFREYSAQSRLLLGESPMRQLLRSKKLNAEERAALGALEKEKNRDQAELARHGAANMSRRPCPICSDWPEVLAWFRLALTNVERYLQRHEPKEWPSCDSPRSSRL